MNYPRRERGVEICVTVEREGVFLYGNRAAFRSLARYGQLPLEPERSVVSTLTAAAFPGYALAPGHHPAPPL
jgi:hypothetical protein